MYSFTCSPSSPFSFPMKSTRSCCSCSFHLPWSSSLIPSRERWSPAALIRGRDDLLDPIFLRYRLPSRLLLLLLIDGDLVPSAGLNSVLVWGSSFALHSEPRLVELD